MIIKIPALVFSGVVFVLLSFIPSSSVAESKPVQYQPIPDRINIVSNTANSRENKSVAFSKRQNKKAKKKSHIKKIDEWNIQVSSKEQAVVMTVAGKVLLNVHGPSMKVLFVSVDHFPVSIAFVRDKIKEWKGDEKSLRVQKLKDRSIFSFRVQDHVHWFSSEGGYLLATVDQLNRKQYLSLLKRVTNRGKSK